MIAAEVLNPAERVALAKAIPVRLLEQARAELTPGKFEIDVVLGLRGPLVVAPEGEGADALRQADYRALLVALIEKHPRELVSLKAEWRRDRERFLEKRQHHPSADAHFEEMAAGLPTMKIAGAPYREPSAPDGR